MGMLKRLLLFLCICQAWSIQAQTPVTHPFPTDSAVWYETRSSYDYHPLPMLNCSVKYFYNGSDTINGLVYKKLYKTQLCYCQQISFMAPCSFTGYQFTENVFSGHRLRTDSNRVYLLTEGFNQPEYVLYDYNLQVGDSFTTPLFNSNLIKLYCFAVDSTLTNTGYRKQWDFIITHSGLQWPNDDTLHWVEGITSSKGLFYEREICLNGSDSYDQSRTQCFALGDTFVLGGGLASCEYLLNDVTENNVSQPTIFPNPATNSFTIQFPQPQKFTATLYNLTGEQVGSYVSSQSQLVIERNNMPAGLYFVRVGMGNNVFSRKIVLE